MIHYAYALLLLTLLEDYATVSYDVIIIYVSISFYVWQQPSSDEVPHAIHLWHQFT